MKTGDLQDAETVYSDLAKRLRAHHTHHAHRVAGQGIEQEMSPLPQALQSGNLSATQQAYSTLQQGVRQFQLNMGVSETASTSTASRISFQA